MPNVVCLTILHRTEGSTVSMLLKMCCGVRLVEETSVIDVLGLVLNDECTRPGFGFKSGSTLRL